MARFRLQSRDADGTAHYEGVNERSSLQLTVHPDGSQWLDKEVVGFCRFCWSAEFAGSDVCLFPGSPHGDKLIKQSRESDGSRPVVAQDPVPVAGTSSPIAQNGAVVQDEVQHRIPPPVVSTDDEHIAPVVELQVPVSPSVVHGAEVLARGIWRNGGTTRDRLVPDRAHPSVIEPMVDLAVSKGWLVVHGENVDQGSVNPTPWSAVPSDSSSAWGPGVRSLSR